MWLQTLATVGHSFASFFYEYVDIKVKVLFSFKMNSKQFYSFDIISLLWSYYPFGSWLLLALKLTNRIIRRGGMVRGGWKILQS